MSQSGTGKKLSPVPVTGAAVTAVWKPALEAMISSRLPSRLVTAVGGALTAGLDRLVFNRIVAGPSFCTFGSGFQLKVELSNLLDFMYAPAQAPYLKQHNGLLAHVTETSSLLTISKEILTDRSVLESAFPNLNPRQIRTIIGQYQPEPGSSDVVAPSVLAFFDRQFNLSSYPLEVPADVGAKFLTDLDSI